jgi:uroporphyrinogen decarboxylase
LKEDGFTPRERWLAVLNHRKPDRVPMDYWATGEVTSRLMKHLGCSTSKEVFEKLHIDAVFEVSPEYIGSPIPENSDLYDCHYRNVKHETGIYSECVYHPLAKYKTVSEIKKNFEWPSVDIFDYSVIPEQTEVYDNYPIRGGGSEPFLTYKNLRGMRQAYLDLYMHSDIVHYCLDKLFDFCYDNTNLIYDQAPGKVLLSYVAEDFGSQNGLLVSPAHIQEYFLPRMKRMMDLAHNNGVYVFFHSDGSIKKIIPDMIRAGIDILNPIQWRCKDMNREVLKDEFGDKVVFHGAMDNQYTLAFGTQNDVRQEVRDNLRIMGKEGGYILAPCHNIQPITPTQNILVMYEEGYKQGI